MENAIELKIIPHYTTLLKASWRLLGTSPVRKRLDETVHRSFGRWSRVPITAIDSTGLECSSASADFVKRRKQVGEPRKHVAYHWSTNGSIRVVK